MLRNTLCLILLLAAWGESQTVKPDVLLITIDTLRADRLGCYGYAAAKTPNIDRIAAEGILFTNAVSHVPLTRPSHTCIFTGLYPYEHGVHDNIARPLDPKIPTMAEVFKAKGYRTGAFPASFVVNSQSGLDRGFDVYEDRFDPNAQPTQFALNLEKRGGEVLQQFSSWLAQKKAQPYFAWVHLYDPHFPYSPPSPYSETFKDHPYDGEIAYADEIVGKIMKLLNPNTLLILVSDHGESLGEHGENAHSYFIYDATLRVPMMFRWPGTLTAGTRIPIQARLIDILPTTLDLAGMQPPAKVSGISLKPWMLSPGKADPHSFSYAETFTPYLHFGWSKLLGVRADGWKFIQAPRSELYNVNSDPRELQNVFASNAAKSADLRKWLQSSGALEEKPQQSTPEMDPETLEKLASLGYAGVAPGPAPGAKLPDPKDKLEDFKLFNKLIREGIEAFQKEDYKDAAAHFQQLRDRNIPSFEVHYYLGRSLLRLKSYDTASTELEMALAILPDFLPAYRDLSESYEASGKAAKAEAILLQGLKTAPNNPTIVGPLAWLYQRQKKYDAAEALLTAELKQFPGDVDARFRLGALYRDAGKKEPAIAQFREILKVHPEDAEAHNQIGMIYGAAKQMEQARAEFAAALKLDPHNEDYKRNLALTQSSAPVATMKFRIIQTKTQAAADLILRKLNSGGDWDALARDYSIHPSARSAQPVLEMSSSDLEPAIAAALSSLKTGEISAVLQTPSGFFLLRRE